MYTPCIHLTCLPCSITFLPTVPRTTFLPEGEGGGVFPHPALPTCLRHSPTTYLPIQLFPLEEMTVLPRFPCLLPGGIPYPSQGWRLPHLLYCCLHVLCPPSNPPITPATPPHMGGAVPPSYLGGTSGHGVTYLPALFFRC